MSWRFVARRVLVALATLAAIVVFNFFLFRTLGDPSKDLIRGRLKPDVRAAIIHERGYDQSQSTQFRIYVVEPAARRPRRLDASPRSPSPTSSRPRSRTRSCCSASRRSSRCGSAPGSASSPRGGAANPRTRSIGQVSLAFYSMPDFWLGMLFIGFFAGTLAWLPGGSQGDARRRGRLGPHRGRRDPPDPADAHARAR